MLQQHLLAVESFTSASIFAELSCRAFSRRQSIFSLAIKLGFRMVSPMAFLGLVSCVFLSRNAKQQKGIMFYLRRMLPKLIVLM